MQQHTEGEIKKWHLFSQIDQRACRTVQCHQNINSYSKRHQCLTHLCILVFSLIIFDSASKACFNLSSLSLFVSSYFFSVSSIFFSKELTKACIIPRKWQTKPKNMMPVPQKCKCHQTSTQNNNSKKAAIWPLYLKFLIFSSNLIHQ